MAAPAVAAVPNRRDTASCGILPVSFAQKTVWQAGQGCRKKYFFEKSKSL
jgi:hypothetical protein